MEKPILAFVLFLSLTTLLSDAKQYMRCELTRELIQKYKFDRTLLSNWICMIEHESERDTTKISPLVNGNARYGLFQISSTEWCGKQRKGGICNVLCDDFVDDNIADDVSCVRKVFERDGFKHWAGWNRTCRSMVNLPNLNRICRAGEIR